MKNLTRYFLFPFMTGLTLTNGISVMAASCNSHINKEAQIQCDKDDNRCLKNKSEKDDLDISLKS